MDLAYLPDGSLYLLGDDGQWHHIPDVDTANKLGVDWNALPTYDEVPGEIGDEYPSLATPTAPSSTATLVEQQPSPVSSTYSVGSLIGLPDQRVLLLGADGQWHWIPDTETFNTLQLRWDAVSWVATLPGAEGSPYASAAAATTPGDWQASDNFQAPPPRPTNDFQIEPSVPSPALPQPVPPTPPGVDTSLPQPAPGETTPGDWTTGDIYTIQPSPPGTPIPVPPTDPPSSSTQHEYVGRLPGPGGDFRPSPPPPPWWHDMVETASGKSKVAAEMLEETSLILAAAGTAGVLGEWALPAAGVVGTGALAWELAHLAAGAAIAGENPSEAGNLAWNAFLDVLQTRVKLAVKAADVPKTLHVLLDALAFVVGLRAAAPDPSYPIPKDVMPSPSSFIDVPDWVAARGLAFVLEWIKQQL